MKYILTLFMLALSVLSSGCGKTQVIGTSGEKGDYSATTQKCIDEINNSSVFQSFSIDTENVTAREIDETSDYSDFTWDRGYDPRLKSNLLVIIGDHDGTADVENSAYVQFLCSTHPDAKGGGVYAYRLLLTQDDASPYIYVDE